ncbi:MAG: hypothetical protein Q9166_002697 [cf. Caloplaca sp. 2 TL-2023]
MATHAVIDLSLSTDDENVDIKKIHIKPAASTRKNSGSGSSSDRYIEVDDGPRKKRKLSPPGKEEVATSAVVTTFWPGQNDPHLPTVKASESFIALDDDDPIVWTSSPRQKSKALGRPTNNRQPWTNLSDSDESLPDGDWLRTTQPRPAQAQKRLSQTANARTYSEKAASNNSRPVLKDKGGRGCSGDNEDHSSDGSLSASKPTNVKGKRRKHTNEEKDTKVRRNEEAKAAGRAIKLQEKEELKERKRLLKEEQARQKQKDKDRAEVNRLKLDKKLSTPEMIVDLPISIDGTTIDTQTREALTRIGVEITSYQSSVPNLIKWRRKIESRFNAETGAREKLQIKEVDPEKHVMCLMSANEFVQLARYDANDGTQGLDDHVSRVRSSLKDCIPVYLIEGLDAWMRKNRNAKNRAYQAAVLGQPELHEPENSIRGLNAATKRRKRRVEVINEDIVEDALLRLQVINNCLVHHAAAPIETAEWIADFTEQISQIPYRYVIHHE